MSDQHHYYVVIFAETSSVNDEGYDAMTQQRGREQWLSSYRVRVESDYEWHALSD